MPPLAHLTICHRPNLRLGIDCGQPRPPFRQIVPTDCTAAAAAEEGIFSCGPWDSGHVVSSGLADLVGSRRRRRRRPPKRRAPRPPSTTPRAGGKASWPACGLFPPAGQPVGCFRHARLEWAQATSCDVGRVRRALRARDVHRNDRARGRGTRFVLAQCSATCVSAGKGLTVSKGVRDWPSRATCCDPPYRPGPPRGFPLGRGLTDLR